MKVELRKCNDCGIESESFKCNFERGNDTFDLCDSCVEQAQNKITSEFGYGLSTCQGLDYLFALFESDMVKRAREVAVKKGVMRGEELSK